MVEIDEVEEEENEKLENKIEKEDAKDSYSGLKWTVSNTFNFSWIWSIDSHKVRIKMDKNSNYCC